MGRNQKLLSDFLFRLLIIVFFIIAFVLSGCVRVTPQMGDRYFTYVSPANRQSRLAAFMHFNMRGAFSIKPENRRADIANFWWRQLGIKNYVIHIASALDIYSIRIVKRMGRVTVTRGPKQKYTARSAEAIIRRQLGWELPITNLIYWVRAIPAPGPHVAKFDHYGHLLTLRQQGWKIAYSSYRHFQKYDLPGLIVIQRPGLIIRIAIKNWFLIRSTSESS